MSVVGDDMLNNASITWVWKEDLEVGCLQTWAVADRTKLNGAMKAAQAVQTRGAAFGFQQYWPLFIQHDTE